MKVYYANDIIMYVIIIKLSLLTHALMSYIMITLQYSVFCLM